MGTLKAGADSLQGAHHVTYRGTQSCGEGPSKRERVSMWVCRVWTGHEQISACQTYSAETVFYIRSAVICSIKIPPCTRQVMAACAKSRQCGQMSELTGLSQNGN